MRIKDRNISHSARIDPFKIDAHTVGKEFFAALSTGATYDFLLDKGYGSDRMAGTISGGYDLLTTGRNDVLYVSPDSNPLSETLTWSKNLCHLVGMSPNAELNKRARIGMSTAFSPMITVSGYNNLFKGIYTMHGTAAADYIGWYITGHRNVFEDMHFGGPMNALQGGHVSYAGVSVYADATVFRRCVFGTATLGRDEVTPNVLVTTPSNGYGITDFIDCDFYVYLTDGNPVFVKVNNASGVTWLNFKRCRFHAISSNMATAMTVAFTFAGGATCGVTFDNACQFINVSAICDTAYDQYIWLPRQFVSTTDTEGMRSVQLTI